MCQCGNTTLGFDDRCPICGGRCAKESSSIQQWWSEHGNLVIAVAVIFIIFGIVLWRS